MTADEERKRVEKISAVIDRRYNGTNLYLEEKSAPPEQSPSCRSGGPGHGQPKMQVAISGRVFYVARLGLKRFVRQPS